MKTTEYDRAYYEDCVQMTLLKDIKLKRTKQRAKQPIRRDVFNRISGIVRQYCLEESFLRVLDDAREYLAKNDFEPARVRMKKPMEFPLFSLVTHQEYSLTTSIIRRVENPYLEFVHSPEEILLCEHLYLLNPSIPPERLMRFHFETLVLHERTKACSGEINYK